MNELLLIVFSTPFAFAMLRVTTPILFASLGALVSDRSGVMNIGLEGMMLTAALVGVITSALTESALVGLILAVLSSMIIALIMAYFSLKLKTNIILAGIAINLFASGFTIFVLYMITGSKGVSTSLKSMTLPSVTLPLIDKIPIIGSIISGHNVLTYFAFIMVIVTHIFLFKSKLGLRLRAVGENPEAAKSVGINVKRNQTIALLLSGMLAGFGGAYMSMGYVSWFSANMTSGRGFIALAASAMGRNLPLGSMLASLFFGFSDALSNSMQSLRVPAEIIQMIPYAATIIGLTLYSMRKSSRKSE